jgi:hypothetical protein
MISHIGFKKGDPSHYTLGIAGLASNSAIIDVGTLNIY